MKLLKTSCLAAGTALLAVSAFAGTQAGNLEIEGAASLSYEGVHSGGNSDITLYQGQVGVGYFVTDAVEVKVNSVFQGSDFSSEGNSSDLYTLFIEGGADYHFMTKEKIVPYVGLYAGGQFAESAGGGGKSNTFTGWVVDAHGGMKQFVGERTAIDYRISYQYSALTGNNTSQYINAIVLSLGVTYAF